MGTPVGMSAVPEFMRLGGSATYEEAEISAVQFYYRWPSDNEKDPITQEPVVKEVRLNTTSEVNSESATIHVTVTVPEAGGDFTEAVRNQVSTNHYGDK